MGYLVPQQISAAIRHFLARPDRPKVIRKIRYSKLMLDAP
jgi:hypothetical protein